MKNLKTTMGILAMAFIAFTTLSCKNETKKTDTDENMHVTEANHHDDGSMNHETDYQKNPATTPIIEAYIQIKNGLVDDSKEKAANGAEALLKAFAAFDMSQLSTETHNEYMEILESAKEHTEHIVKGTIDNQREHFEPLSTNISDMIALLGTEKTLYKDFCPMANNNKGAYWLSEVKDIENPYFGSRMLKCGSVKEQIN